MEQNQNSFAPGTSTDERVPSRHLQPAGDPAGPPPAPAFDFDPVPVRYRDDGWTPERQREYVEALADTGIARAAAARVGLSVQSANRLRRRADGRSFDLACRAAKRHGAHRILDCAFERAIEGTVKLRYWHGEVVGEERVFDNRLLVSLLGKVDHLLRPTAEEEAVADNWEKWVDALGEGGPAPDLPLPAPPEPRISPAAAAFAGLRELNREIRDLDAAVEEEDEGGDFIGDEVWEEEGLWWTRFPPPEDFAGEQYGTFGEQDYERTLTPAEAAVMEAEREQERAEELARQCARRDRFFGFAADDEEADDRDEDDRAEDERDEEKGDEGARTGEGGRDGSDRGEAEGDEEAPGQSLPPRPSGDEGPAAGRDIPPAETAASHDPRGCAPPPRLTADNYFLGV